VVEVHLFASANGFGRLLIRVLMSTLGEVGNHHLDHDQLQLEVMVCRELRLWIGWVFRRSKCCRVVESFQRPAAVLVDMR